MGSWGLGILSPEVMGSWALRPWGLGVLGSWVYSWSLGPAEQPQRRAKGAKMKKNRFGKPGMLGSFMDGRRLCQKPGTFAF